MWSFAAHTLKFSFAALAVLALGACTATTRQEASKPQATMASAKPAVKSPGPDLDKCSVEDTGMPSDVTIASTASAPEAAQKFLHVWHGNEWGVGLCTAFAITDVKPDGTATMLYANGSSDGRFEKDVTTYTVKIAGNKIEQFNLGWNRNIAFEMKADGLVYASLYGSSGMYTGYYVPVATPLAAK